MKAFKFFAMLIAAFALSFTATSCGDDDDDLNMDEIIKGIENGSIKGKATLSESENQLVLTIEYPGIYTDQTTAVFKNKVCTKYTQVMNFASKALADKAWADMVEDGDTDGMTRNGNTIVWDGTEDYAGVSYEFILDEMREEKLWFDAHQ